MTVYKRKIHGKESANYYYKFTINKKNYRGVCTGCTSEKEAGMYESQKRNEIEESLGIKSVPEAIVKIVAEKMNVETDRVSSVVGSILKEIKTEKKISLDEAFDLYLLKPTSRPAQEKQVQYNRVQFNDFVAFLKRYNPEIVYLQDVTRLSAEKYLNYLKTNGPYVQNTSYQMRVGKRRKKWVTINNTRRHQYLSPRTINERHTTLKSIFERLKEDAQIVYNPFNVPKMKLDTISRDIFSMDELQKIFKSMTSPVTQPITIIGLFTGLSLKDICLLRWDEIQNGFIVRKRCKTQSQLEIPILTEVKKFLETQKEISSDSEFIFPILEKMYATGSRNISRCYSNFLKSLEINTQKRQGKGNSRSVKGIHSLRHTFAYYAGIAGIPISTVQSILGHMTAAMTELYQRHSRREDKINSMEQFNNQFNFKESIHA